MEELDEAKHEEQVASKRVTSVMKTLALLEEEKAKVEAKLALLLEEKELVDKHLAETNVKQNAAKEVQNQAQQRSLLLENTLATLQQEIDKLGILQQGV